MNNDKFVESGELATVTSDLPQANDVHMLLVQGGIAVAINLSLALVLIALASLVNACKKPA